MSVTCRQTGFGYCYIHSKHSITSSVRSRFPVVFFDVVFVESSTGTWEAHIRYPHNTTTQLNRMSTTRPRELCGEERQPASALYPPRGRQGRE